ncbi:hypothetical protein GCM10023334_108870 [Nonomuraea thailandensis]
MEQFTVHLVTRGPLPDLQVVRGGAGSGRRRRSLEYVAVLARGVRQGPCEPGMGRVCHAGNMKPQRVYDVGK